MIASSKPFDDLKIAIEAILNLEDERESVIRNPTFEKVDDWSGRYKKSVVNLRAVYALYFVEPEDDKEFESWKSPLEE